MSRAALLVFGLLALTARADEASTIQQELRGIAAALQAQNLIGFLVLTALASATLSANVALSWPRASRRAGELREAAPRLCLALGTLNLLGLTVLSMLLAQHPQSRGVALLAIIGLSLLAFGGVHVAAGRIGHRWSVATDRTAAPWVEHATGLLFLSAHALVPIVGWLYAAYQLTAGAGAVVLVALRRESLPLPDRAPTERSEPPSDA